MWWDLSLSVVDVEIIHYFGLLKSRWTYGGSKGRKSAWFDSNASLTKKIRLAERCTPPAPALHERANTRCGRWKYSLLEAVLHTRSQHHELLSSLQVQRGDHSVLLRRVARGGEAQEFDTIERNGGERPDEDLEIVDSAKMREVSERREKDDRTKGGREGGKVELTDLGQGQRGRTFYEKQRRSGDSASAM